MASRKAIPDAMAPPRLDAGTSWPEWADPQAVERLRGSLREERLGHAYMLSGPPGVGKAELALAFARALCCTESSGSDRSQPCCACRACRNVDRGAHPDVETFDLVSQTHLSDKSTASNFLGIDTVRRLRSSAALLPLEAGHRVLIVDDAETLQEPAQQALLKTLEEPPPAVTLLVLTDESEALLDTVRSRCQEIRVRRVTDARVTAAVMKCGVDEHQAREIASLSRGAPAWALAAVADKRLAQARLAERTAAEAWLLAGPYDRLVTAFRLGEQFGKRRMETFGIVQAATQLLRDRMLFAAGIDAHQSSLGESCADPATMMNMGSAIAATLQCLSDLEANVRPRLALEAMVVQWPNLVTMPR